AVFGAAGEDQRNDHQRGKRQSEQTKRFTHQSKTSSIKLARASCPSVCFIFIIASEKNDCQACPAPNHTEFQNEAACHPKSPLKKARPAPKELDGRGKSRCVSGLLP
ncbi:MAG: hypothetical protein MR018_00465, partial [Clostridiales bacterium]|nr:hypothetical protein [Clostridiales bacterium]MDD7310366.1 hypothetical protein [Eubacteriales bacterium]MDY5346645.1 hypothetical protein [Eubacteriales bacterium]